jgi:hypothetical protein
VCQCTKLYERQKRTVLSRLRKTVNDGAVETSSGRLFQTLAAATAKARSPTASDDDDDDRRRDRQGRLEARASARGGALPPPPLKSVGGQDRFWPPNKGSERRGGAMLFQLKMHQNAFGGRASPGQLSASKTLSCSICGRRGHGNSSLQNTSDYCLHHRQRLNF